MKPKPTTTAVLTGMIVIVALSTATALAGPPSTGLVVEGERVPDLVLGDSRSYAQEVFGSPTQCLTMAPPAYLDTCTWRVDADSQVSAHLVAPDGGPSTGGPDDVVAYFTHLGFPGWETRDGLSTAVAEQDPEQVLANYPNAVVADDDQGQPLLVLDVDAGIQVSFSTDPFTGARRAAITIFSPSGPMPLHLVRSEQLRLDRKSLRTALHRYSILATDEVLDERGEAVRGAVVTVTWYLPDGSTLTVTGTSDQNGVARFRLVGKEPGVYGLNVDDISSAEHLFDSGKGMTEAVIEVGP